MEELTMTKMSIQEVLKKKSQGLISPHHSLQRLPGQWNFKDKGNYISDILQGLPIDPLKLGEEKLGVGKIIWILDGVQRTTIVEDYINNKLSIAKNVERYMIEYVVPVVDEDGIQKRDENGKPISEIKTFDIRGKKFKQLPPEMQDNFIYYKFNVFLHPDCSGEAIAYHLKRYNAGKPMNSEQKGFTYIGDHFANIVRNISTMSFFEDAIGKYTQNDFKVGKVNRVIAESLMTTKFLGEWSKDFATNCKYINKNASDEDFEWLRGLIERLEDSIDTTVGEMFDSKNSFLWFGLYEKFIKLGLDDSKFNTFMLKLNKGMYAKDEDGKIIKDAPMTGICVVEIDGTTWEELLKNSSTKDVNIVKTRIDFLIKLMCNYFGVDTPEDTDSLDNMNEELLEFVNNFSSKDIAIETLMLVTDKHSNNDFKSETISNMIRWYEQFGDKTMLNDCLSYKSYLEDAGVEETDINLPLYVFGVKYIFDKEIDIDIAEWLTVFKNIAFREIDNNDNNIFEENSTIVMKQQEVISNIKQFITKVKEEDDNV